MPKGAGSSNVISMREVMPAIDHDTIECLEALMREAVAGRIIGLAFVAIRPGTDDGIVHACGEATRRQALTRGLLHDER